MATMAYLRNGAVQTTKKTFKLFVLIVMKARRIFIRATTNFRQIYAKPYLMTSRIRESANFSRRSLASRFQVTCLRLLQKQDNTKMIGKSECGNYESWDGNTALKRKKKMVGSELITCYNILNRGQKVVFGPRLGNAS